MPPRQSGAGVVLHECYAVSAVAVARCLRHSERKHLTEGQILGGASYRQFPSLDLLPSSR